MSDSFENIDLEDVRMIYFKEREIRVVLKNREELVFTFPSQEQMDAALAFWEKKRPKKDPDQDRS